jgi:hypothetical protein
MKLKTKWFWLLKYRIARFRMIAEAEWDFTAKEYMSEDFLLQVSFFHIPIWFDIFDSSYFDRVRIERDRRVAQQGNRKKRRVIKPCDEVIEMLEE